MEFLPLVLGTDANSYSVAYSLADAFQTPAIVCGAARLVPFVHTSIAKVYTERGFSTDDAVFVRLLEKAYRENAKPGAVAVVFGPTEGYIRQMVRLKEELSFPVRLPYPTLEIVELMANKSMFYGKMEEWGMPIPQTKIVTPETYAEALDTFDPDQPLFLKADDWEFFETFEVENVHKGYPCKNPAAALEEFKRIYTNGFEGKFVIQQMIHGGAGTEISVNGYRGADGTISLSQAVSILEDERPTWVGNHLVLVDNHEEEVYRIAEEIVNRLDYRGFFNFDFKRDVVTGALHLFECNPRLGRSFYYCNLSGVNFPAIAVHDLVHGDHVSQRAHQKFAWIVPSLPVVRTLLDEKYQSVLEDAERLQQTKNVLALEQGKSFLRDRKINDYQKKLDQDYLSAMR